MKLLTKITFTTTAEEATMIGMAIEYFRKAAIKKPEIMQNNGVTSEQLSRLLEFNNWIKAEIADLNAWNTEIGYFENLTETDPE